MVNIAYNVNIGNTVKFVDLWETVRKNGFTPKETIVLVRGGLQGKRFQVSGTNQEFDTIADPKNPKAVGEAQSLTAKELVIRGLLTPQKDVRAVVPLVIKGTEEGR